MAMEVADVSADISVASQPFLGLWQRLVSTTNWEKGRIIHEWRAALSDAGQPPAAYADETWAALVGQSVSGQHVGRLRRVYQRFGNTNSQYAGLFWSHFQAAIEWEDAEMWLEGAVQNDWSVSQLRRQRALTLGTVETSAESAEGEVVAERDEDVEAAGKTSTPSHIRGEYDQAHAGPMHEGPDFGDEDTGSSSGSAEAYDRTGETSETAATEATATQPAVQPFVRIGNLPEDVLEAFDAFKLAIVRHKSAGWLDVQRDEIVGVLEALKELALAHSGEADA